MAREWVRRGVVAVLAMAVLACTPALNWREVRLNRLNAWLPCKPDTAQRTVRLGGHAVVLNMAGCEAGDGVFAISHTVVPSAAQVSEVLAAWRAATLANMRSSGASEHPLRLASGTPPGSHAMLLHATGQRADGNAVQAQLAWFAAGQDVFHIAVYARQVSPEMAETLFTQARVLAKQP